MNNFENKWFKINDPDKDLQIGYCYYIYEVKNNQVLCTIFEWDGFYLGDQEITDYGDSISKEELKEDEFWALEFEWPEGPKIEGK